MSFFFWPLCCLSLFDLRLQIITFGHCAVCPFPIYGFRWTLGYLVVIVLSVPVLFTASDEHWYLLVIVLSVPLLFTASDDHFGILSLCCLSLFYLQLQMTTLVSCGYCAVCPSSIYGFRWPLWYLLVIVLSVPVRFTASDDHFGILSLCCLSLFDLRLQMTTLVSCHCAVCPCSIYGFRWTHWYIVVIVLTFPLRFTASDDHFGILWSLCCLSLFYLRLQMTTLVSCGHCVVCPSSIYGFRWPLWYLVIVLSVPLLFTASNEHWYLVVIVLSVPLLFTASDEHFGILWSLCCLSLFYLQMTTLVSCGHCAVCPSSIFRWPLWYLVIVLSVPLRSSDDHFGILWSLCCLSLFYLQMTTLVSCGHCAVCPSSIFRWPLWYLVVIVLSVPLLFTAADDHFGILWSLYCLSLFDLQMTTLVSCSHCAVCPSSIFRWPLWYLVVIVLSVPLRSSENHFGILCCLSLFYLRLQMITLVSSSFSYQEKETIKTKYGWSNF